MQDLYSNTWIGMRILLKIPVTVRHCHHCSEWRKQFFKIEINQKQSALNNVAG